MEVLQQTTPVPNHVIANAKTCYLLNAVTDDARGVLGRMIQLVYKSNFELKSVSISETDINGLLFIGLKVVVPENLILNLARKMEKIIEVQKVICYPVLDQHQRTIAYYRLAKEALENGAYSFLQKYGATIVDVDKDTILVEKIGCKADIEELYQKLDDIHLVNFCSTGLNILQPH
jgi:acetolactate synthase small subunit